MPSRILRHYILLTNQKLMLTRACSWPGAKFSGRMKKTGSTETQVAVGRHGEASATGLMLLVCAEPVETEVQAGHQVNKLLKVSLRADNQQDES